VRFTRTAFKVRGEPGKIRQIQLGEAASQPLPSFEDCVRWINEYWPDKRNGTCGFHIHVSVKDKLRYARLMDKAFYDLFLKSAYDFAHRERMSKEFFQRLDGKNRYCKKMFDDKGIFVPEKQIDFQHNHQYNDNNPRYAHLNFCFRTHGTMENRLPTGQMPKGKAIKTLKWYLDLIESYLEEKDKEDKGFLIEVPQIEQKGEVIDLTNRECVLG
jgi:hypothetical protein